ncbi:MAG: Nre family DNA repair protein [Thermoplasmata archaeon]|nr:Nre family DNA repair protein [Thermoplasmata archaeon]
MNAGVTPPFPGLAPHPSISYEIPGLREDPTLCLRCRAAQGLCGKPVCPILLRYDAFAKTLPMTASKELEGTSPPALFIGRFGWPKVSVGPLLAPELGDTRLLDHPEKWVGRPVAEVVAMRTGLIRGTRSARVESASRPDAYLESLQLLSLAAESPEAEANFRRAPRARISLSDTAPPFGPSAPLESVRLDVRRVDARLEKMSSDLHAPARTGVEELYSRSVPVSRIQRAFSAGVLGRQRRRRFVPTRWSITAVDDLLSRANLERVRDLPELSEILLYRYTALDNRWLIVLLPGAYRYESIEAWYPNTLWNPSFTDLVMMGDSEGHDGRTTYASIGGCYYAARLATSEGLLQLRRQAGVVVLREVHPGEILPLGVWNVREHVRAALQENPERLPSLDALFERVRASFAIELPRWIRASSHLRDARYQRRLEEFDRTANPGTLLLST